MTDFNNLKISTGLDIKVLGTGCLKCKKLEELTKIAVEELNVKANITKVEDIAQIMQYGIMSTPGLVIDEKVVISGNLPKLDKIKELIIKNLSADKAGS